MLIVGTSLIVAERRRYSPEVARQLGRRETEHSPYSYLSITSVKAQASSSNLCSEIRHESILTYGSRLMFVFQLAPKALQYTQRSP
jgi:hypothetical protein